MKKLFDIIPSNLSSALGWTLIHCIWQGIAIVLIFSILRVVFKLSSTRYWLGIGALSLQFLAAIITFLMIFEPANTTTYSPDNQGFTGFLTQSSTFAFVPQKLSILQQFELFLQTNLDLFVTVWVVGTSLLLLRLLIGFFYVQGLKVQQVSLVSADIEALMNNLLEKIQIPTKIKLLESARATVPMTIGWLKPVILLPLGIATGLTVKQLEAILAHELAHIKRYDYLVNIFQSFIEILFFFHPATWFISAKIRDERENCCDDFAVEICGDSMVLAHALTQVASYQQQPHLAMAFGAKRQSFMDRIKRIIGINTSQSTSYDNWTVILGMILVIAFGVVYAQKEVVNNGRVLDKTSKIKDNKLVERTLDLYYFKINDKAIGVFKNRQGKIKRILVEGNEIFGDAFEKMKIITESYLNKKDAKFSFVAGIADNEVEVLNIQFFPNHVFADSSSHEEVEAEMNRLSKELEKYSNQIEREANKQNAEMGQSFKKMDILQQEMQLLSVEIQEQGLRYQKLASKYHDRRELPADIEEKMQNFEKEAKKLENQMKLKEIEISKVQMVIQNDDYPKRNLNNVVTILSSKMDSLDKIIEEKGKLLEKLAKEEESHIKKELRRFSNFLMNENLIKDSKDFELRLKGDKLLINLEPQSVAVYDKVYNWLNQDMNWGKRLSLKDKDFEIAVKGENLSIKGILHGNRYYHRSSGFVAPPSPPSMVSPTPRVAPVAPQNSYAPTPRVAPQPDRVNIPQPPKPPKAVKVSAIKSDFNITKEMILDNKGTCTIYVVSQRNGKTIAKALPAILSNDKWIAKGLKKGDLVVIESKEKLKDGDKVVILSSPKIGQIWQTPEQRGQAVMGNEDPELERNEEGKNTSIYANPLLLNGKPLDYSTFSIKSKGLLTVMKGKPTSPEAVKIPFRFYLRRNGMIVYEKKSTSKLTQVEISEVLALSKVGDQLIINPTEKVDFKAKRIINILL